MKTHFIDETIPKGGQSGTIQTPNGLQNGNGQKLRGNHPSLAGFSWSPQSGRSPARGSDESALMMSQLG
jgi:hypothetical protein